MNEAGRYLANAVVFGTHKFPKTQEMLLDDMNAIKVGLEQSNSIELPGSEALPLIADNDDTNLINVEDSNIHSRLGARDALKVAELVEFSSVRDGSSMRQLTKMVRVAYENVQKLNLEPLDGTTAAIYHKFAVRSKLVAERAVKLTRLGGRLYSGSGNCYYSPLIEPIEWSTQVGEGEMFTPRLPVHENMTPSIDYGDKGDSALEPLMTDVQVPNLSSDPRGVHCRGKYMTYGYSLNQTLLQPVINVKVFRQHPMLYWPVDTHMDGYIGCQEGRASDCFAQILQPIQQMWGTNVKTQFMERSVADPTKCVMSNTLGMPSPLGARELFVSSLSLNSLTNFVNTPLLEMTPMALFVGVTTTKKGKPDLKTAVQLPVMIRGAMIVEEMKSMLMAAFGPYTEKPLDKLELRRLSLNDGKDMLKDVGKSVVMSGWGIPAIYVVYSETNLLNREFFNKLLRNYSWHDPIMPPGCTVFDSSPIGEDQSPNAVLASLIDGKGRGPKDGEAAPKDGEAAPVPQQGAGLEGKTQSSMLEMNLLRKGDEEDGDGLESKESVTMHGKRTAGYKKNSLTEPTWIPASGQDFLDHLISTPLQHFGFASLLWRDQLHFFREPAIGSNLNLIPVAQPGTKASYFLCVGSPLKLGNTRDYAMRLVPVHEYYDTRSSSPYRFTRETGSLPGIPRPKAVTGSSPNAINIISQPFIPLNIPKDSGYMIIIEDYTDSTAFELADQMINNKIRHQVLPRIPMLDLSLRIMVLVRQLHRRGRMHGSLTPEAIRLNDNELVFAITGPMLAITGNTARITIPKSHPASIFEAPELSARDSEIRIAPSADVYSICMMTIHALLYDSKVRIDKKDFSTIASELVDALDLKNDTPASIGTLIEMMVLGINEATGNRPTLDAIISAFMNPDVSRVFGLPGLKTSEFVFEVPSEVPSGAAGQAAAPVGAAPAAPGDAAALAASPGATAPNGVALSPNGTASVTV